MIVIFCFPNYIHVAKSYHNIVEIQKKGLLRYTKALELLPFSFHSRFSKEKLNPSHLIDLISLSAISFSTSLHIIDPEHWQRHGQGFKNVKPNIIKEMNRIIHHY